MKTIRLYICCIAGLIVIFRCSPPAIVQQASLTSPPAMVVPGLMAL